MAWKLIVGSDSVPVLSRSEMDNRPDHAGGCWGIALLALCTLDLADTRGYRLLLARLTDLLFRLTH